MCSYIRSGMYVLMWQGGECVRRTKEDAQETRSSILHAALDIFCEKPYAKVSLNDIALAIGMTKGAVYWHFKNKDDLFVQLMVEAHKETQRDFAEVAACVDTLEGLRDYYKSFIDKPKDEELYVKLRKLVLRMNEWPQPVRLALLDLKRSAFEREKRFVATILDKCVASGRINSNVDCDAVSEAIVSVLNGLGNLRFMDMLTRDFAKHLDFIFNAFDKQLTQGKFPPDK